MDRPEEISKHHPRHRPVRVRGHIPTPVDWEGDGAEDARRRARPRSTRPFIDRMLEVLRKSPVLHLGGGKTVTLQNIRPPAKTLSLSAEALVDATQPQSPWMPYEAEGRRQLPLREARRHRLRPGERRGEREAGLRGRPGGARQGLHAPLRHRLRHPAERPRS